MKILIITDSFNHCCGRSRHISLLAESLQRYGHEVFVIYGGGDGVEMLESINVKYELNDNILHANRSYLSFVKAIINIYQIQKEMKFDILHTHHSYVSAISKPTSKIFGIPQVFTIHSSAMWFGKLPKYIGDYFIAVSEEIMKMAVKENKKLKEKIITINNGINLVVNKNINFNLLKKEFGINEGAIVISIIGRIVEHKGHKILLEAVNSLNLDKEIVVLVLGEGNYYQSIIKFSRGLKIKTIFAGLVKNTDEYFALSNIIAVPSLCCEGLPITILEAGKFSKPVVASSIEGIKNIIEDGVNGLIVHPGSKDELSKAIELLINNEELRVKLGKNLRKTVKEAFSREGMTQKVVSIYEDLIK